MFSENVDLLDLECLCFSLTFIYRYCCTELQSSSFIVSNCHVMMSTELFLLDPRTEKAHAGPPLIGTVKTFCREKGHGFIQPADGTEPIFVHISEYV